MAKKSKGKQMKRPKTIILNRTERIVAVVPEHCAGPGWANAPTWVVIVDADKKSRMECIQPDERTNDLHALFSVGAVVHSSLMAAIPVKRRKEKTDGKA